MKNLYAPTKAGSGLLLGLILGLLSITQAYAQTAYFLCDYSMYLYDMSTGIIADSVSIGSPNDGTPIYLEVSKDGSMIYVVTSKTVVSPQGYVFNLLPVEAVTLNILDTILITEGDFGLTDMAIHPDGSKVYASFFNWTFDTSGLLSVINVTDSKVDTTFRVTNPESVAVLPAGDKVYWGINEDVISYAIVMDPQANQLIDSIEVPFFIFSLDPIPDGSKLYLLQGGGSSMVVDTDVDTLLSPTIGDLFPSPIVARFSPDGGLAYVLSDAVNHPARIYTINDTTGMVIDTTFIGDMITLNVPAPKNMDITPDGSQLYLHYDDFFPGDPNGTIFDIASQSLIDSFNICFFASTGGAFISPLSPQTSLESERLTEDWQLYPNPVKDKLSIAFSEGAMPAGNFQIFTLAGQLIQEGEINRGQHVITWNVQDLAPGMYYFRMNTGEGNTGKLFFKQE